MFPKSIQKLIDIFSKFPTVGPRTGQRFVFYLISQPKEKIEELLSSIQELKNKICYCDFCFNPFEPKNEETLCEICKNTNRERGLLCIVEKEADLESIEKTKKYKGLYFILGGTADTLKKGDIEKLRIKELEERLRNPQSFGLLTLNSAELQRVAASGSLFKEIIIGTNPTPEGKTTAILVEKTIKQTLKDNLPKISHLGLGLPVGGELEYADEETLESAFEGRK